MTIIVTPKYNLFLLTTFLIALLLPAHGCQVWLHLLEASSRDELWGQVTPTAPTVEVVKLFLRTTPIEGVHGSSSNSSIRQDELQLQMCRNAQCPALPRLMWASPANFTHGLLSIESQCLLLTLATLQHTRPPGCLAVVEAAASKQSIKMHPVPARLNPGLLSLEFQADPRTAQPSTLTMPSTR